MQYSPTCGSTRHRPPRAAGDAPVDDEQLLVLQRAEAVEDRHDPLAGRLLDALGQLGEQARHEQLGQAVGGGHVGLVDAGFAVDAEAHRHPPLGDGEQGRLRAGERAAREGDAERPGALVRESRHAGDLGEVVALLGGRGGGLEHREVARDAAALVLLGERLEMSSVTVTVSAGMPAARSCSCAASKLSTSPRSCRS